MLRRYHTEHAPGLWVQQSAQGLGKSGGCLNSEGMVEVLKTSVSPATGTSSLRGPSVTSVMSLMGLQPLSYQCDWALEGLHDEVITDEAGTA